MPFGTRLAPGGLITLEQLVYLPGNDHQGEVGLAIAEDGLRPGAKGGPWSGPRDCWGPHQSAGGCRADRLRRGRIAVIFL